MTRTRRLGIAATALIGLLAVACSGGGDKVERGTGNDADYLRAVCVGIDRVSDALVAASSANEIAAAIEEFANTMRAINPPPDLTEYNRQFVAYLDAALKDPTSVVTTAPPLPPDGPRRRLAQLEPSIAECREPTFFSRGLE